MQIYRVLWKKNSLLKKVDTNKVNFFSKCQQAEKNQQFLPTKKGTVFVL